MVTHSLGAAQYGLFNYIKIFFENIIKFLDVGTVAFYPKFSRRPGDRGILRFVLLYDAILFIVSFITLGMLIFFGKAESVLTTKSLLIIFSVFLFTWLMIINQKITSFMDAIGKTITNEVVLLIMRITLTVGLVLLFIGDKLNLATFLHIQNITLIVFLVILLVYASKYFSPKEKSNSVKETAIEFKNYSQPLFWASTMTIGAYLLDRWFLQIIDGSAAQGYFSLGINLGTISILFSGSLAPLLMREYAIAYEKKDKTRMVHLFSKFLPFFYVITATFACFLTVHGDWLVLLIGGDDFSKAMLPVTLLGLASLHQTYGQLSGALMAATDRTYVLGIINTIIAILGIPFTYFLLAPQQYWGLNLGALGLAIKLFVSQIIMVNIQLWFNTRYLQIGMFFFIAHQVLVVILFVIFAFTIKLLVSATLSVGVVALLSSGVLYLILVLTTVFLFPSLISMTQVELLNHIKTPLAFFKS